MTSPLCPECLEVWDNLLCACGHSIERAKLLTTFRSLDTRPVLDIDLWSSHGNAFVVMGSTLSAMKEMGVDRDLRTTAITEMKSGNYVELLRTCNRFVKLVPAGYDDLEDFIDDYEHGRNRPDYSVIHEVPRELQSVYIDRVKRALGQ